MRILVLTYDYPPYLSPRALRWVSIVEEWTAVGHHVDVITAWKRGYAREEMRGGATVFRVSGTLRQWLPTSVGQDRGSQTQSLGKASVWRSLILRTLRWVHQHTWKQLRWPDYAWHWYVAALRQAEHLCSTHSYDALVTVSHPFTAHVVGLQLQRKHKDLLWLADMGDPFSFLDASPPNNHRLYGRLNQFVEGRVFAKSNAVSVTTLETLEKYAEVFPNDSDHVRVIPPLLTLEHDVSPERLFPLRDGVIRLVYVGTVYRTLRNPAPTLALLREARRHLPFSLEFHFFGNVHDCAELFEESQGADDKFIHLHGPVSHQVALQAMRDADVIVNIGNDTRYQLPSKVVEYVASGRPILSVSRKEDDTSSTFFSGFANTLCLTANSEVGAEEDGRRVAQFIQQGYESLTEPTERLLERFSAATIAETYASLIRPESSAAERQRAG